MCCVCVPPGSISGEMNGGRSGLPLPNNLLATKRESVGAFRLLGGVGCGGGI